MEENKEGKPNILVSACLLGAPTRYDGKSKKCPRIEELTRYFNVIPICPETDGGLEIPRPPSEIQGDRVVSKSGKDVTAEYNRGAEAALKTARRFHAKFCVLKERSPSCGANWIHDGSFTDRVIPGEGIAVRLLRENGFDVYSEDMLDKILDAYGKNGVR
jgi:uncharacterized protein YbbK (DUF523 family)